MLSIEDAVGLRQATAPALSPDGRRIAFCVPAQLVIYPREPHSIQKRAHQLDLLRRVLDWFDTYLRAPER